MLRLGEAGFTASLEGDSAGSFYLAIFSYLCVATGLSVFVADQLVGLASFMGAFGKALHRAGS